MNLKLFSLTIAAFCGISVFNANAATIHGRVVDGQSGEALAGAVVQLLNAADTTKIIASASAAAGGRFELTNIAPQNYLIKATFLGYRAYSARVSAGANGLDAGTIKMETDSKEIGSVDVTGVAVRAVQRGDTTEFNADAYKVASDASTEDLIKKMPGITVENGAVKTQGEDVKKVLVDGKPFFGDDPTVAIRNLPAEMVESIEVYDRLSDQAQLTGFDDGESVRTINIKTRKNRRIGQFGRVYGGAGYDDKQDEARWTAGGNVNFFTDKRRISVVGMSNNVNQQNFASEDLAGMSSGGGGGRGRGMQWGGQSGVATTHAVGINYTDIWKENTEVTGSYFINYSDKDNGSDVFRSYVHTDRDTLTQTYDSHSNSGSRVQNHRANLRIDHDFNENTSLLFEPSVSYSLTDRESGSVDAMLYKLDRTGNDFTRNSTDKNSNGNSHNLNGFGNILFRHKFQTKGRSISLRINGNYSDANSQNYTDNNAIYMRYDLAPPDTAYDPKKYRSDNPTNNWSIRSNAVYTEPLGKLSLLQLNYDFNYSFGESNRYTYNYNALRECYSDMDSLLSNVYSNDYYTHRAGLSYRFNNGIINANAGLSYQNAELSGDRIMPRGTTTRHTFNSVLPNARVEFKPTKQQTLRLFYRAGTNAPSIAQLQDVIDNSNTLILSSGNPDLKETNSHMMSVNFNQTTLDKGMTFFAMLWGNVINNYITNATYTHQGEDKMLRREGSDSIVLRRGGQFRQPVNMDGYFSTRANVNFGIPISVFKSNLNLTTSATYSRQPGLINAGLKEYEGKYSIDEATGERNIANSYSANLGLMLGSNISENLDFNIGYNATYNNTINTLQSASNNEYFRHSANARLIWNVWRGLTIYSTVNYDQYASLSGVPYNESFVKWDAGLGKKFWNNQAEVRLMVYDILSRTNNYARNVTDNYIEDSWSRVLTRYAMLTFTYTLRSFGKPTERRQRDGDMERGGPPMIIRGGGQGTLPPLPPPM